MLQSFGPCGMSYWVTIGILLTLTCSGFTTLPQVSQEGLLRPYRSYADVTLFHYYVPREVYSATFEFAASMDSPNCHQRNVFVYLQHGSYPVMAADNSTFPPTMSPDGTSMYNITLLSAFPPQNATVFKVYNPLPGSWFAAGYLPNWDQQVQQQGIGHKCQYSLGSFGIWNQLTNIDSLSVGRTTRGQSKGYFTYYRFYVPTSVWKFKLTIGDCQFLTSRRSMSSDLTLIDSMREGGEINDTSSCIDDIFVEARSLPDNSMERMRSNPFPLTTAKNSTYEKDFVLPYTDSYYYILIVSENNVSYNIAITTEGCQVEVPEKSFVQRFSGLGLESNTKDKAVRLASPQSELMISSPTEECKCVPIFRLTRIKHPQDFSDIFLFESKDWFTTNLTLVTDNKPVGVSFELLPYIDIGGTLSVTIHLEPSLLNTLTRKLVVTGCIRHSRPPETFCCTVDPSKNISNCCEPDLTLHISSKSLTTLEDTVLIPYPQPGLWYISFTAACYSHKGIQVPCAELEVDAFVQIRTQPCVWNKPESPGNPILPCGNYGVCQEVRRGQFFFTTCRCIGGYRGWGCSDDSEATPENLLLLATLLLTISNVFFIPAIFLALKRRMFTQALVYLSTMIASTLYHACDQDLFGYCVTRFQVLQFCDFFASILAFWVTLIALARCPPAYDSVLYILGAIVIAVGVEYNRTGLLVFVVPFALGVAIPISVWSYRSIRRRKCIKPDIWSVILFLPGVCLGGAGLILFAFVETEENYSYTHSAWHGIIALSLLYLLPKRPEKPSAAFNPTTRESTLEVINSAELAAVSDSSPTTSESSPIFFITSELDHLVQPPSPSEA